MHNFSQTILVTGGSGFIGSHFLEMLVPRHPEILFINVDNLTFGGEDYMTMYFRNFQNYIFEKIDIKKRDAIFGVFRRYGVTDVIHFAAQSYVETSLNHPKNTIDTNILGTLNVLDAHREFSS